MENTHARAYLKIKIKTLMAEAGFIRQREWSALKYGPDDLYGSLYAHRKHVVGVEMRATQLVYAWLRDREVKKVDTFKRGDPDWEAVKRMVKRYGQSRFGSFQQWLGREVWESPKT